MSSTGSQPWWVKIADVAPHEREEFMRGAGGASKTTAGASILYALVAGYVGGKIAQRTGDKK
jgi:hypothetical protein